MSDKQKFSERYVRFLLRHKIVSLIVVVFLTSFFGFKLLSLEVATDFFSFYPPSHPHIKLYNEYREMFGTANTMVCGVEVEKGDIYTSDTIRKIDRITQEILDLQGANPTQVVSITHPKLKNVTVNSWGIQIRPLMWPSLPRGQEDLRRLEKAVYQNAGVRGFYVSGDDKASAIYAGFWEEGVNPLEIYAWMEKVKAREADENTNIYFTGYPVLYAHVYHLASQIYIVLGVTLVVMLLLLWFYFRSWRGVFLPTLSAALSAVWGLGFASWLGINLDPLILVIPIIISARILSHTVQTMARYEEECVRLNNKEDAIVTAYSEMLAPSALSVLTDATGVLFIAVATIPLMRDLAFFCSFWILTIFVTVPSIAPIVLSFLKMPSRSKLKEENRSRIYIALARLLVRPSRSMKSCYLVLFLIVAILIGGGYYSLNLHVGDAQAGATLFYQDHPYNVGFNFFNEKFVGSNQLVIIAEGKEKGAIKNHDSLKLMEDLQRYMEIEANASGSLTMTNMIKRIYRMFHEGYPKWGFIPHNEQKISQIGFMIECNSSSGEMDRWVDETWTNATVSCFYKDYDNQLIKDSIEKAKSFINERVDDSSKIDFRLAGGIMGILYAMNEEIEFSYWASLIAVFLAVLFLCSITYRSFIAGLVLVIPLGISQVLAEVFMLLWGIDLNINSLPVAAIAIGIGVDYGIYLTSRIAEEYKDSQDYDYANRKAIETTGQAIIFTATTLIAGVFFWLFVDLKFQAEMGLLLGLLMLLNMINALVFIPVLVKIMKPKFVVSKKERGGIDSYAVVSNT